MVFNPKHLSDAEEALSLSVESMERRITGIDAELGKLRALRKFVIQQNISQFLPDFSSKTLRLLLTSKPAFVTAAVTAEFAKYKNLFWFFKPPGADQALAELQTRFTKFLVEQLSGELADIEHQVLELSKEKNDISRRQNEALELLRLISSAIKTRKALPVVLQDEIRSIADQGQRVKQQISNRAGQSSRYEATVPANSHVTSDDLWLYAFTGIPTSTRTFMWDFMRPAHDHAHQSHGNFSDDQSIAPTPRDSNCAAGFDVQAQDRSAPPDGPASLACIDTSDALGRFS